MGWCELWLDHSNTCTCFDLNPSTVKFATWVTCLLFHDYVPFVTWWLNSTSNDIFLKLFLVMIWTKTCCHKSIQPFVTEIMRHFYSKHMKLAKWSLYLFNFRVKSNKLFCYGAEILIPPSEEARLTQTKTEIKRRRRRLGSLSDDKMLQRFSPAHDSDWK